MIDASLQFSHRISSPPGRAPGRGSFARLAAAAPPEDRTSLARLLYGVGCVGSRRHGV
jgi:hypothetical protein